MKKKYQRKNAATETQWNYMICTESAHFYYLHQKFGWSLPEMNSKHSTWNDTSNEFFVADCECACVFLSSFSCVSSVRYCSSVCSVDFFVRFVLLAFSNKHTYFSFVLVQEST